MTALGNIVVHLLTDGRQAWPGLAESQEAAETAVEQLLRTIPLSEGRVLPGLIRRAVEEVEVGGVTIPAGAVVAVQTNAANRDPDVFPPAPRDRSVRPLTTPSVVFGPATIPGRVAGPPGAGVGPASAGGPVPGARAEFSPETIEWREGQMTRGPRRLPVSW